MTIVRRLLVVFAFLVAGAACQTSLPPAGAQAPGTSAVRHVDRAQLMRDVTALSAPEFEGRGAGSPGGLRARRWLVERFAAIGLSPLHAGFEHRFTFDGREAANVIGYIEGRELPAKAFVITAHYDHLGIRDGTVYPGADDNASGVAALLAAARHFSAQRPRHSFIFGALDAEEAGQRGAKDLLASPVLMPADVALNVNLDMVSRSRANELFAAGTSYSPWMRDVLRGIQPRVGVAIRFGHDQANAPSGEEDWTHASDHGPFHDAGIPFVYFGVEDHADYHKPTDTADRIEPRFFGDAVDAIIEAVRAFDAALN